MVTRSPSVDNADPVPASLRRAVIGPITANIAFVIELTLVPLLLPAIQMELGLSISELAWVFNAYGIAVAIGVLLGGWCGDAFSSRKVFGYGVAFFALGSLIVAAAQSFEVLMVGRAVQGFGGGIFSPLVPLLLTRASPRKPGRVLIIWGSIAGYVAAFAPLLYGSVLGQYGWHLAFVLTAIIAGIALFVLSGSRATGDFDRPTTRINDFSALFRTRDLWLTYAYVFCTYGAITYYLFRLPVWLSSHEFNAVSIGFALSVLWLTFSALSALLRNMVDKPHIRAIMLAAPLLITAGFALFYFNQILPLLILSAVLVGAGLACSNAPSTQMILRFAPAGMSAVSASLDITFARLGGIATVAILAEMNFAFGAVAISMSCLVAALCALSAKAEVVDVTPG